MGNQKTGQKEGIPADQTGIERWADNFSVSQGPAKHFFTEQGAQEPSSQAQAQASSAALSVELLQALAWLLAASSLE